MWIADWGLRMGARVALVAVLGALTVPVEAQQPPIDREMLQERIMQRFVQNFRQQAQLTDAQEVRLREVMRRSLEQRAELQQRERRLWMALEGQMRPGVAASEDSLTKLLDGLLELGAQRVEHARQEQRAYAAFLTPVQRAQLTIMWRRMQQQIERIQEQRRQNMRRPPA